MKPTHILRHKWLKVIARDTQNRRHGPRSKQHLPVSDRLVARLLATQPVVPDAAERFRVESVAASEHDCGKRQRHLPLAVGLVGLVIL